MQTERQVSSNRQFNNDKTEVLKMKPVILKGIMLIILMLLFCSLTADVLAQVPADKNGELTIPWDEFKNLLNLDKDQILIPLETFQKLLAQTGITTAPPHTLQSGNVILSRSEFA